MKISGSDGRSQQGLDPACPDGRGRDAEGRTRDAVARLVQRSGPQTAAALAEQLALSPAAIRRHLEALVAEGVLTEVAAKPSAGRVSRGRGRPARLYALTDKGRGRFGHAYDELAVTALRFLREAGGEQALTAFADDRATALTENLRRRLADRPSADARTKAELVAEVLTEEGYVASAAPAGQGTQVCQHHCPVVHVAAEFPELCEAETRALAAALGTNVQRLATIAHGDGVCTTHIPTVHIPSADSPSSAPSRSTAPSSTGG